MDNFIGLYGLHHLLEHEVNPWSMTEGDSYLPFEFALIASLTETVAGYCNNLQTIFKKSLMSLGFGQCRVHEILERIIDLLLCGFVSFYVFNLRNPMRSEPTGTSSAHFCCALFSLSLTHTLFFSLTHTHCQSITLSCISFNVPSSFFLTLFPSPNLSTPCWAAILPMQHGPG